MPITKKVLGQSFPAAATLTTLYTVPASTQTTVSTITVCNRSGTVVDQVRISIAPAGAADAAAQYIYGGNATAGVGLAVSVLDTFSATLGITLAATDVVRVYSVNGTSTFNIFGAEES